MRHKKTPVESKTLSPLRIEEADYLHGDFFNGTPERPFGHFAVRVANKYVGYGRESNEILEVSVNAKDALANEIKTYGSHGVIAIPASACVPPDQAQKILEAWCTKRDEVRQKAHGWSTSVIWSPQNYDYMRHNCCHASMSLIFALLDPTKEDGKYLRKSLLDFMQDYDRDFSCEYEGVASIKPGSKTTILKPSDVNEALKQAIFYLKNKRSDKIKLSAYHEELSLKSLLLMYLPDLIASLNVQVFAYRRSLFDRVGNKRMADTRSVITLLLELRAQIPHLTLAQLNDAMGNMLPKIQKLNAFAGSQLDSFHRRITHALIDGQQKKESERFSAENRLAQMERQLISLCIQQKYSLLYTLDALPNFLPNLTGTEQFNFQTRIAELIEDFNQQNLEFARNTRGEFTEKSCWLELRFTDQTKAFKQLMTACFVTPDLHIINTEGKNEPKISDPLKTLRKKFETCKAEIKDIQALTESAHAFDEAVKKFYNPKRKLIKLKIEPDHATEEKLAWLNFQVQNVLTWYSENPKLIKPDELIHWQELAFELAKHKEQIMESPRKRLDKIIDLFNNTRDHYRGKITDEEKILYLNGHLVEENFGCHLYAFLQQAHILRDGKPNDTYKNLTHQFPFQRDLKRMNPKLADEKFAAQLLSHLHTQIDTWPQSHLVRHLKLSAAQHQHFMQVGEITATQALAGLIADLDNAIACTPGGKENKEVIEKLSIVRMSIQSDPDKLLPQTSKEKTGKDSPRSSASEQKTIKTITITPANADARGSVSIHLSQSSTTFQLFRSTPSPRPHTPDSDPTPPLLSASPPDDKTLLRPTTHRATIHRRAQSRVSPIPSEFQLLSLIKDAIEANPWAKSTLLAHRMLKLATKEKIQVPPDVVPLYAELRELDKFTAPAKTKTALDNVNTQISKIMSDKNLDEKAWNQDENSPLLFFLGIHALQQPGVKPPERGNAYEKIMSAGLIYLPEFLKTKKSDVTDTGLRRSS